RSMPEEVNRVLVDQISNYLLITEESARNNLIKEGISDDKIYFVGNVMIDSLISNLERQTDIISRLDLVKYCVVTLHRPSNVDDKLKLIEILDILTKINQTTNIVWPIHPRTKKNIAKFGLEDKLKTIKIIDPLGYLDFITLTGGAQFLLTDSGGIQEETTYLGVPCLTMRQNTERPITIEEGTNVLVNSEEEIFFAIDNIGRKKNTIPKYWDGKSAKRIIDVILKQGVDKGGENATLP
ncbi:MAG TPA: UDP-N-acetylglucosamine 2-epimerase, partial [Patescibacteria group bacterium]|nr:UDP-N-acetylglucosamine 2-epimerase [Patescibacteria group bacterium]